MIKATQYYLKSFRVIWSFFRAAERVTNSVLGPICPFLTFFPMRDSFRLELNLDVTLALMDFFFVLPSTRLVPIIYTKIQKNMCQDKFCKNMWISDKEFGTFRPDDEKIEKSLK
jgi:hypothetical protein